MNLLMAVEKALKDSLTGATYHPHKNIAGFQQTLYIKTYNNLYCKITEDKPSNQSNTLPTQKFSIGLKPANQNTLP